MFSIIVVRDTEQVILSDMPIGPGGGRQARRMVESGAASITRSLRLRWIDNGVQPVGFLHGLSQPVDKKDRH
jgi:hypothetical protein